MRASSRARVRRLGVTGLGAALLAVAGLTTAPAALADSLCSTAPTLTWTGAGDGSSWTDPNNWDGTQAPGTDPFYLVIKTAGAPDATAVVADISGVTGTACGITVDRSASPSSASVAVTLHGGLAIGGDAATPTVELSGSTLALADGTSQLTDGTSILSTNGTPQQPFGSFNVGTDAVLQSAGQVEIGSSAALHLQSGGTLDATTPSTLAQITIAQGAFDWDGGTVSGTLTDDVLTTVSGAVAHSLAPGSTLTNKNAIEVEAGTLDIASTATLFNRGILRLLTGVTVAGAGVLENGPGGTPTGSATAVPALLAAGADGGIDEGAVTITGVAVHNVDQINVDSGVVLQLAGSTQSWSHNNSSLSGQPITTHGRGVLQIGTGETLSLQGTTRLSKDLELALDDGGNGTTATLAADMSFGPVSLTATSPSEGVFAWGSGTVRGPLTVNSVYTALTKGSSGSGSQRFLAAPATASSAPALTLAGNTTSPDTSHALSAPPSPLILENDARVVVSGQFDLPGPGGGMVKQSGTSGQSLTIASGATLRRRPAATTLTTPYAPAETATINVPITNRGTVELDASLNAAGGYVQQLQAGVASTAARPLTALIGYSTLTAPTAVNVTAGGLGGKGTVHAPTLSMTGSWLGAGYRANCHEVTSSYAETCIGTLHVAGTLKLSSTSDLQVVIRKETVSGKTTIAHDTVAVTGATALAGTLTAATGSGYTPVYGQTVNHVVTLASRSGAFTRILSPLAPVGYGWRPSYDDNSSGGRGVDVRLVDTGPPVIGFASLPAFTQQNVLEVHYAAHDNQTGVASFDVRWRRAGGLDGTYSAWVAPRSWQHTTANFQVITGVAEGYTYCVQVRARDKAGNVSPWTAAPCTARELDDRFLRATGTWSRTSGHPRFYDGTYSRTTSVGATLSKYGTYTRVAVSAYRCPTCGTLKIYSGSTLLKTWVLTYSKYGKANWVSPVAKVKSARVRLVVVSSHKLVQIDALGLLR